jgi:transglutaminase-like putative cysteine protease
VRASFLVSLAALVALACLVTSPALAESTRTIRFSYAVEIGPFAEAEEPAQIFVPLAESDEHQRVVSRKVTASIPGAIDREDTHGNVFWHAELDEPAGQSVSVRVDYVVERAPWRNDELDTVPGDATLTSAEVRRLQQYLDADTLVPVNHPVLKPALEEIRRAAPPEDMAKTARAIYDWLVDNIEYKKVGTGWGNGDTFWACSERYGNCTDFHSLFNALARSSNIPARFEIGFPISESREGGTINGYHCWAEFYLPGAGWIPIDASEAFKHPERREEFFGSQSADRIRFSTGRDIELSSSQTAGPLNYFVYPHVELGGKLWKGPMEKTFTYEDITPEKMARK